MSKQGSTPEQRAAYKDALAEALRSVCFSYLDDSVRYIDFGLLILGLSASQHWWRCYGRRGSCCNCHGRSANIFLI